MDASSLGDSLLIVAPAPGPELERLQWFESVKADLRKASGVYKEALAKETLANMAVFIAEAEVEAAVEAANAHSVQLKQHHTAAVALVNQAEAAVGDAVAEVARRKFGAVVDAYKQALESRARVLYVCHTETLASRQALGQAMRKRDACKAHLVTVVKERNVAEEEVARIHTLYVDKHDDPEELLKVQLARVRCAADASPDGIAKQCAPTPFGALLVANAELFA